MNTARSIPPSDLKQPTDYKPRYERAEHQRSVLAEKVKRLELERDGLLFRLEKAEAELRRRGMLVPARQARLAGVGQGSSHDTTPYAGAQPMSVRERT